MHTIKTAVYTFDELSDDAKEQARQWYREGIGDESYWYESIIDEAKDLLGKMGFEVKDIRFSGFSSQGDGASFTGIYSYAKGSAKAIASELPKDDLLQRIVRDLTHLQKTYFYQLSASITPNHSCHYVHEYSTHVDLEHQDHRDVTKENYETFRDVIVEINRWIYRWLQEEWDYQHSDECVDESIRANAYTFTASGKRFG